MLFTQYLAPRWWHGRHIRRLRAHLGVLAEAAAQVEAAVGQRAWAAGAQLYLAYFHLEVQGGIICIFVSSVMPGSQSALWLYALLVLAGGVWEWSGVIV